MPVPMIHFLIAKKVKPDASIDFYVGNLSPDAIVIGEIKQKVHLYHAPDPEDALRQFALKANNDYLKGMVLHLFADKKFHSFWNENTSFPWQENKEYWVKYMKYNRQIDSYVYHNTEWAYSLLKQMENWDYSGFTETEFISKDCVELAIEEHHKWLIENKFDLPSVFPPPLVEKLVDSTAEDFNKWVSNLKSEVVDYKR